MTVTEQLASTIQNSFFICKSALYYQSIFLSIDTRHNAVNFFLNPQNTPFKWNKSVLCYDCHWVCDWNFCAWVTKTWILFKPEELKWWNYSSLCRKWKEDISQSIWECDQVSLLPKYTKWSSIFLSVWSLFCCFVVGSEFLLGDFLFLCWIS